MNANVNIKKSRETYLWACKDLGVDTKPNGANWVNSFHPLCSSFSLHSFRFLFHTYHMRSACWLATLGAGGTLPHAPFWCTAKKGHGLALQGNGSSFWRQSFSKIKKICLTGGFSKKGEMTKTLEIGSSSFGFCGLESLKFGRYLYQTVPQEAFGRQ